MPDSIDEVTAALAAALAEGGPFGWLFGHDVSYKRQQAAERERSLGIIADCLEPLIAAAAELDLDDPEVVVFKHRETAVRLFELGEFDHIWLHNLSGFTTLYIGENGEFYVYGPVYAESDDDRSYGFSAESGVRFVMRLQPIKLEDMTALQIVFCRELASRPHLSGAAVTDWDAGTFEGWPKDWDRQLVPRRR